MSWKQLHIQVDTTQVEQLSDLLSELGAVAVTVTDAADQPIYEPPPGTTPVWDHSVVTGLFDAAVAIKAIVESLQQQLGQPLDYRSDSVSDQDWVRSWMDDFQPMQFGQRLWIVPSWHQPPDPEAVNIQLDPGLAFGTGTHATTALCLEWLDAHPPQGQTVIDYGCGSGVLAIAALLLGASEVIATDNDPQALQATRDNARQNGVEARLEVLLAGEQPIGGPVDTLLANILAWPLINMAPQLAALVKGGGHIVLSGILAEQADDVTKAYAPWFEMCSPAEQEGWIRLEGRRK